MNTLVLQRTTKAVAWIVAISTALAFAAPQQASAFQSRGATSTAKWVSQMPGAAANGATVINAEGGDVLNFGLTIQNTSATDVFYSADQLADEPAPYVGAHEFRVGATADKVYDNIFDFSDSNFVNNNRFATFQSGAAVAPGQNLEFKWSMKVKSGIADGTYRFAVGVVQEFDAWLGDAPAKAGANNNLGGRNGGTIFWDIVIGEGSSMSGDLEGTAGDITVTALSIYGDEEVGEDAEDVEVAAFDVEADDSSDVEITSIKVELAQQTAADSMDLTDYASEISIWMDGEEVGRVDADEFTENADDYTKSISLDGAIVRAGETNEFVLAVSALSNLDSGDIDTDDWQIGVSSIRFLDGDGVTTTDAFTLDIDDNAVDDTIEEEFDFASFASANNVELKVALNDADEDINDAHVIDIDDTQDTDEVEVLSFTIEADGDSDLNIQEVPATITTTGETDEAVLVQNAQLWFDGESIATDTIPTGGAVVFEDLDVDIQAGEMGEFKITVDIQDTTGAADNGDTVQAELTTTNTDAIVAEDESGERIADADASGSAQSGAHAVYDAGIMVEFVSATAERTFTADASGEDDQGTYKITFDVTAFDGDMRIDTSSEVADANAAGQGVEFSEVDTAGTPVLGSDILESNTTDTEDNANVFEVDEGTTRRFTLTVIYAADSTPTDGSVYVKIDSINWGTATDDTNANYYEFNLGDYKTDYLFLNGIA